MRNIKTHWIDEKASKSNNKKTKKFHE